jgi:hypothetical protein
VIIFRLEHVTLNTWLLIEGHWFVLLVNDMLPIRLSLVSLVLILIIISLIELGVFFISRDFGLLCLGYVLQRRSIGQYGDGVEGTGRSACLQVEVLDLGLVAKVVN